MPPTTLTPAQISHHIKGLRPVLELMDKRGFSPLQCLQGTGITLDQLEHSQPHFSLQQEFTFYRNLLALSRNPLLGLDLGNAYRLENYGLFGYALLSAPTVGDSLSLAVDLGALSFTHFGMEQFEEDGNSGFAFHHLYPLPQDLLQIYCDRDIQAVVAAQASLGLPENPPIRVRLMHNDHEHLHQYREHFQCPVTLNHHRNEILIDSDLLNQPLPQRDMETSNYCREQCLRLLEKLSRQGTFVDSVREAIIAKPGYFPGIGEVAEKLGFSVRTLRRHLDAEGSSFQRLLTEIRHQLAQDYLLTEIPIEQIAELLGYSETGNFSHAFKRWQGVSPKFYRQQHLGS